MQERLLAVLYITAMFSFSARAFNSRVEAGLGFTNNAYLSSSDTKSDLYLKVADSSTWEHGEHKSQLRIGFRDYFKTHDNDLLNWYAGDKFALTRAWSLKAGGFGNHYVRQSPGTTDESFSNVGAEAQAETSSDIGLKHSSLTWGPGVDIRRYISVSQRTDATLKADGTLEYEANSVWTLDGFAQGGCIFSSDSDYSRAYLDLGVAADYTINKIWLWNSDLDFRHTTFLSRTATTVTATAKSRGKGPAPGQKTVTTPEEYNTLVLTSKLIARFWTDWSAGGQVSIENQSSVSGYESYSALGLYAFLIKRF